ncbi:MAG: tetratricopeptide repeat protein [Prolixibacteraceae bacterium]|jgi:tetratricopeptide (TPR) repeat protein|nr:tetratricopeptide repeat protein [Prolixibacteraceae bacterium]
MKRSIIFVLILIPLFSFSQLNTNHVIHTGRSRLYFGNYTGAIQSFNMVAKIKPYLPEPYYYRGVAKLNLEDYRGAKKDLNTSIEIKPFYPEAIMYRGVVNYHLKEYDLAMKDYSQAMELDGENADIYNNRGICKAAMKDFEGAINDYTKSIDLKAKNFNGYLNRSIAYQIQEKWDLAIADCNQMIRIRPNSPLGYMSRGLIKIEKENFAGALRDFDMAIYLDPQNAFAYQNRGMVKQQLESYEAAIMDYTSAIELNNRMASAYFNRGIAKEMLGKNNYQKDYDYASLLDPRFEKRPWQTAEEKEEAQKQQLLAWKSQGNQSKNSSSTGIKDTVNTVKDDDKSKYSIDLEDLRKRKMKANLVVEDNREIPGEEQEDPGKIQKKTITISLLPLFEVAVINNTDADNESVGYFNMTIENLNAENNYQPYLTLTNLPLSTLSTSLDYTNYTLAYDERIKQNNKYSNNYLYRGIFKSLTNDFINAIEDFDKAIEIDERNLLAYFMRANTKSKMIETIESISNTININSSQNQEINDYPKSQRELNEINAALKDILTDYSVVLYMNPNFAFGYFNRGNIYCKNEKYLSAMDEYDKAIKIEPGFAEAFYNRGLIRILLNDIEGGAKDLSRAGELGIEDSYNVIKRYCN